METLSVSVVLCESKGGLSYKGQVVRSFDVAFIISMNKVFGQIVELPIRDAMTLMWRHCNDQFIILPNAHILKHFKQHFWNIDTVEYVIISLYIEHATYHTSY